MNPKPTRNKNRSVRKSWASQQQQQQKDTKCGPVRKGLPYGIGNALAPGNQVETRDMADTTRSKANWANQERVEAAFPGSSSREEGEIALSSELLLLLLRSSHKPRYVA